MTKRALSEVSHSFDSDSFSDSDISDDERLLRKALRKIEEEHLLSSSSDDDEYDDDDVRIVHEKKKGKTNIQKHAQKYRKLSTTSNTTNTIPTIAATCPPTAENNKSEKQSKTTTSNTTTFKPHTQIKKQKENVHQSNNENKTNNKDLYTTSTTTITSSTTIMTDLSAKKEMENMENEQPLSLQAPTPSTSETPLVFVKKCDAKAMMMETTMLETYVTNKQYSEALVFGLDLWTRCKEFFDENNLHTLHVQLLYGRLLINVDKHDEALVVISDCYERRCKTLGLKHQDTLITRVFLHQCWYNLRMDEKILEESPNLLTEIDGIIPKNDFSFLVLIKTLMNVYGRNDKVYSNVVLGQKYYDTIHSNFSAMDVTVLRFDQDYIISLLEFSETDVAIPIALKYAENTQTRYGRLHPLTITSWSILAECYMEDNQYAIASKILEDDVMKRYDLLQKEEENTENNDNNNDNSVRIQKQILDCMFVLGRCYGKMACYEKAVVLGQDLYPRVVQMIGEKGTSSSQVLYWLFKMLYRSLHHSKLSESVCQERRSCLIELGNKFIAITFESLEQDEKILNTCFKILTWLVEIYCTIHDYKNALQTCKHAVILFFEGEEKMLTECYNHMFSHTKEDRNTLGMTCRVCMTEPKTCVFIMCGHYCVCETCMPKITKCPICRGDGMHTAIGHVDPAHTVLLLPCLHTLRTTDMENRPICDNMFRVDEKQNEEAEEICPVCQTPIAFKQCLY
jgi:tetratricopeptide (TPR) repeat protein